MGSLFSVSPFGLFGAVSNAKTSKLQLFVDGKPGKEYDAVSLNVIGLRPAHDDVHVAYEVHGEKEHGSKAFVVLDGQEGKPYDAIPRGRANLSPDGTVNYVARSGRKNCRVMQRVF